MQDEVGPMHSHQLSIARVWLPRQAALPPRPNFYRGVFFGIAFSLPIWAAVIWGIHELFK